MESTSSQSPRILATYGTMYYVTQMDEAVEFFRDNLSIEPSYQSPEWTEFKINGHSLCLHYLNSNQVHPRTGILILKVKGLRDLVAGMKENGVKFHSEIKEVHKNAYAADFFDSDGNILSLYEDLSSPTTTS